MTYIGNLGSYTLDKYEVTTSSGEVIRGDIEPNSDSVSSRTKQYFSPYRSQALKPLAGRSTITQSSGSDFQTIWLEEGDTKVLLYNELEYLGNRGYVSISFDTKETEAAKTITLFQANASENINISYHSSITAPPVGELLPHEGQIYGIDWGFEISSLTDINSTIYAHTRLDSGIIGGTVITPGFSKFLLGPKERVL